MQRHVFKSWTPRIHSRHLYVRRIRRRRARFLPGIETSLILIDRFPMRCAQFLQQEKT